MFLKVVLFFCFSFFLNSAFFAQVNTEETSGEDNLEIEIVAANNLEKFTLEVVDQDYVRILGGVILEVNDKKNKKKYHIEADIILINQKINLITAEGNVNYYLVGDDGTNDDNSFTGESLTIYTDPWKGVIYDVSSYTKTDASEGTDATSFRYSSEKLRMGEEGVIILDNSTMTSSDRTEPYYRIKVARLWLTGLNEWGVLSPVLYVGEVPLFWFPFFFQPGNEIVFNPVVGTYTREGGFIQTTTYFYGQKAKEDSNSSFSFLDSVASQDKYRTNLNGLYLFKQGDKDYEAPESYVKLMADWYSRLGYFAGVEGKWVPQESSVWLNELQYDFALGRSRTINPTTNMVVYDDDTAKSNWNQVYSFGKYRDFRYSASLDFRNDYVHLEFPNYSDPYFKQDFYYRSETYNWVSQLLNEVENASFSNPDSIASYNWQLTFNIPTVPTTWVSPYLNTLSISELYSRVEWVSKNDVEVTKLDSYSPTRQFFVPDKFINRGSMALGGTLFDSAGISSSDNTESTLKIDEAGDNKLRLGNDSETNSNQRNDVFTPSSDNLLESFAAPTANQESAFANYRFDYNGNTIQNVSIDGNNKDIESPTDINYDFALTNYDSTTRGSTTQAFSLFYGYLVTRDVATVSHLYNKRSNAENAKATTSATSTTIAPTNSFSTTTTLVNSLSSSLFFFKDVPYLSTSSLSYVLNMNLYEDSQSSNETAVKEDNNFQFTNDTVTQHSLKGLIAFDTLFFDTSFSATTNLKPKADRYDLVPTSAVSAFDATFRTSTQLTFEPFDEANARSPKPDNYQDWTFQPLNFTFNYNPLEKLSVTSGALYDYNLLDKITSFNVSTNVFGFNYSYNMLYTNRIVWENNAFVTKDEKDLLPSKYSLGYDDTIELKDIWKNRIDLAVKVDTKFEQDLQTFTNSTLSFGLGLDFDIYQFLTLKLASTSSNNSMFLYNKSYREQLGITREYNFWSDLWKSFQFGNQTARSESFFNLDRLNITLVHKLGEWDLSFETTLIPRLKDNAYSWKNEYSIAIAWNPIPELNASYKKDENDLTQFKIFDSDKTDDSTQTETGN